LEPRKEIGMDIGVEKDAVVVRRLIDPEPLRRKNPSRTEPTPLPIPEREPALVPAKVRIGGS